MKLTYFLQLAEWIDGALISWGMLDTYHTRMVCMDNLSQQSYSGRIVEMDQSYWNPLNNVQSFRIVC